MKFLNKLLLKRKDRVFSSEKEIQLMNEIREDFIKKLEEKEKKSFKHSTLIHSPEINYKKKIIIEKTLSA